MRGSTCPVDLMGRFDHCVAISRGAWFGVSRFSSSSCSSTSCCCSLSLSLSVLSCGGNVCADATVQCSLLPVACLFSCGKGDVAVRMGARGWLCCCGAVSVSMILVNSCGVLVCFSCVPRPHQLFYLYLYPMFAGVVGHCTPEGEVIRSSW